MQNNEIQSQNTRFIYSRATKEKIPCTKQQFKDFYRMADAIRKKKQYHHRCKCPKQFIWACDGDWENCEHHLGYKELSLEAPNTENGDSFMEMLPYENVSMEQICEDRILLEQLFQLLHELDPDADRIISMWMADDKISDCAIAEALGRKQRTFADQMKRIRAQNCAKSTVVKASRLSGRPSFVGEQIFLKNIRSISSFTSSGKM